MNHNLLSAWAATMLMLLLIQPVCAQDSARSLSLKEAVDLCVKNSKQLKNSQAKIEEATAALKEAVQRRLPDASVGGSYLYVTQPDISLKVKSTNSGGGGGSGGLNLSNIKVSQAMYGVLNVSLPVFTGFQIKAGIESAQFLEKATRLDADEDKQAVIQNAINSYAALYKAKAAVGLVEASLGQSKQRVNDFTNLEQNGLMARNDLLKAELESSNLELTLLDAENNWKLANVSMNLLLGLPEQTPLNLDSASLLQAGPVKSLEEYELAAVQNRFDVQAIGERRKAAESGIVQAKSAYYPNIALTAGYIALNVPNLISVTNAVTIGAGVKYNLGSLWKTDAKVQQAKAREKQTEANQEILQDNIRLEVNQAYENFLSGEKKIDVYLTAIVQAEENYKITKNKYDNSLVTTTDLLDAEVADLQARLNHVYAQADAVVAYNRLLQVAGLLQIESENK
jgi:outer membrane protein TolC